MAFLPLLRIATGSRQNARVDAVWMQALLKMTAPDGLVPVPMKGRPWSLVNIPFSNMQPVWNVDGSTIKIQDPSVSQIASPYTCQRAIATTTVYYVRDNKLVFTRTTECAKAERTIRCSPDCPSRGQFSRAKSRDECKLLGCSESECFDVDLGQT